MITGPTGSNFLSHTWALGSGRPGFKSYFCSSAVARPSRVPALSLSLKIYTLVPTPPSAGCCEDGTEEQKNSREQHEVRGGLAVSVLSSGLASSCTDTGPRIDAG